MGSVTAWLCWYQGAKNQSCFLFSFITFVLFLNFASQTSSLLPFSQHRHYLQKGHCRFLILSFLFKINSSTLHKKKRKEKRSHPHFLFFARGAWKDIRSNSTAFSRVEDFPTDSSRSVKVEEACKERTKELEWRKDPQIRKSRGKRKTFLIQQDIQCFRGNSVSIETILLKMPLVCGGGKIPYLHPTALYAHKYRNLLHLTRQHCVFAAPSHVCEVPVFWHSHSFGRRASLAVIVALP